MKNLSVAAVATVAAEASAETHAMGHQAEASACVAGVEDGSDTKPDPLVVKFDTPPDVTTLTVDGCELLCDGFAVGCHPEHGIVQFKRRIEI